MVFVEQLDASLFEGLESLAVYLMAVPGSWAI
jgi:hypothetical protein